MRCSTHEYEDAVLEQCDACGPVLPLGCSAGTGARITGGLGPAGDVDDGGAGGGPLLDVL